MKLAMIRIVYSYNDKEKVFETRGTYLLECASSEQTLPAGLAGMSGPAKHANGRQRKASRIGLACLACLAGPK